MAECIVDVINSNCSSNNNNSNCTGGCDEQNSNNQLLLSVNVLSNTAVVNNELNNFFLFKDKVTSRVVPVVNSEPNGDTHQSVMEDQESICSEEDNCRKKRRCTDRYDSSESSDSGVAVHCTDCGSSNSDITEPCSPLSTTSLDDMPPTAVVSRSPAPPSASVVLRRPPPPPSPVGDTTSVQWPWTDPPCKRPKQGKITEYFRAKGGNNKNNNTITSNIGVVTLNKENNSFQQPWVSSPVSKFLTGNVKAGVSLAPSLSLPPSTTIKCDNGEGDVRDDVGDDDVEEEEEDDDDEEEDVGNRSRSNRNVLPLQKAASSPAIHSVNMTSTAPTTTTSSIASSSASTMDQATAVINSASVTASATATPATVGTKCNVISENAEENSSSSSSTGSDVSSMFTTTTTRTTDSSDVSRQHRQQQQQLVDQDERQEQEPSPSHGQQEGRTIRFPVINGWRGHYVSDVVCRWTDCEAKFSTTTALLEHLQINHVNSQTLSENYVCRWSNCKVYDRKSCSRTWLERHVLSHGGNKPYRCIVDGCGHRFSSQTLLQRHVNNHFTERDHKGDSKKGCEAANKLIRRNGKKLRLRRQPFSARLYDYFDAGIMEGLQHNLIKLTERRTQGYFDSVPGDSILLQSKVLGKKVDEKGETRFLLRWFPNNVISDEWVCEEDITRTKTVAIRSLPMQSKDTLYQYLMPDTKQSLDRGRRRKQTSSVNSYISYNNNNNSSGNSQNTWPMTTSSSSCGSTPASSDTDKSSSPLLLHQTLPSSVPLSTNNTTTQVT